MSKFTDQDAVDTWNAPGEAPAVGLSELHDLLPCTFCGGEPSPRLTMLGSDEHGYYACKKCGAYSGPKTNTLKASRTVWNTRAR